jgi:hypothetical protein
VRLQKMILRALHLNVFEQPEKKLFQQPAGGPSHLILHDAIYASQQRRFRHPGLSGIFFSAA